MRWNVKKPRSLQRRMEESLVGEAVISSLVAVILMIGLAWTMPNSFVKSKLQPPLTPIAASTGLQQGWRMYAPEPITNLEHVDIIVTMGDGSQRVWTNPSGDKVLGSFGWYKWQKLKENLVREPGIRAGVAHWVVRQLTKPGEQPTRVQMILYKEALPPPGADGPRTKGSETLYNEELAS